MKKTLKKLTALLLVAALAFSVSACANESESSNESSAMNYEDFRKSVIANATDISNIDKDVTFVVTSVITNAETNYSTLGAANDFFFQFEEHVDCEEGDIVVAHTTAIGHTTEEPIMFYIHSKLISVSHAETTTEKDQYNIGDPNYIFGSETRAVKGYEFKYMGNIFALGDKIEVFKDKNFLIYALTLYNVVDNQIIGEHFDCEYDEISYDEMVQPKETGFIIPYVGNDGNGIYVYFQNKTNSACKLRDCEIVGMLAVLSNTEYKENTFELYGGLTATTPDNIEDIIRSIDKSYIDRTEDYNQYEKVYEYKAENTKFLYTNSNGFSEIFMVSSEQYDEMLNILLRGAK